MHRAASAVISLHAGKNKKIFHLMYLFKNIFPKAKEMRRERETFINT